MSKNINSILEKLRQQTITPDKIQEKVNNEQALSDLKDYLKDFPPPPDDDDLYDFLIHENCPDVKEIIDNLTAIAESRSNDDIKKRMLKGINKLKFTIGEQQAWINNVYQRIKQLSENEKMLTEKVNLRDDVMMVMLDKFLPPVEDEQPTAIFPHTIRINTKTH